MKISPNDPMWSAVLSTYESALPPASVNDGRIIPLLASLSETGCVAAVIRDGTQLGARLARVVSTTRGWPSPRIGGLSALAASASAVIPDGDVVSALRAGVSFGSKIIVGAALKELDAALTNLTGVPILGWIVGIGRVVWQIVEQAREHAPEIADRMALAYDRDADNATVQHVLDMAADSDWTQIFMPPPGAWQRERLAYTASGLADGDAWGQLSGLALGGIGAVPGIAEIAGYWQSPRNMPGSSRWADRLSIQSAATLLPSTTTLFGQLWCAAQTGGLATTGRIDFARVSKAWTDYTIALQQFAGEVRGGGDAAHAQASARHGWLADQIVRGWSWDISGTDPYYGLTRNKVPPQYRIGLLDRIIAWRCEQARQATMKAWRVTTSAAYVPEDAPALADAELREVWSKSRARLLNAPHRPIGIDLELVQPGEYREALAKRTAVSQGAGPSTGGDIPLGTFEMPRIKDGVAQVPEGDGGGSAIILGGLGLLALLKLLR